MNLLLIRGDAIHAVAVVTSLMLAACLIGCTQPSGSNDSDPATIDASGSETDQTIDQETEQQVEPDSDAETEPEAEPEADIEADQEAEPEGEPEAKQEAEPEGEPEGEPEAEAGADPETEPEEADAGQSTVDVTSCDGKNTATVAADATGQALASSLLAQWQRDHPEADWVTEEKAAHVFLPPADNSDLLQGDQGKSHAYGNYTERDLITWTREIEKFVAEGSRIFHSGNELGSEIAVSCDMCHPHASNTHPETYPKYQTQLGRVVLLRDMINWCVENPVRAEPLDPDGPKMRALEAYIMAQRKGTEMNYGKH